MEDVINLFLEVTPGRLRNLLEAATLHNQHDVREIAHTVKGSAAMVGAKALQMAAAAVEQSANQSGEESPGRAQRLVEIFVRTRPVLLSLVYELGCGSADVDGGGT